MRSLHHLVLVQSFAAIALAQTFVVDASNGAGTNFTSLVNAVATVPDGATLLVRSGTYPGTAFTSGKGMTIVGLPGANVDSFAFSNTTVNQRIVLRGLLFPASGALGYIDLQHCAGPVLVEDCGASVPLALSGSSLLVDDCAQVFVTRSNFWKGSLFQASTVVLTNCSLSATFGASGVAQTGGQTTFVDCTVTGGVFSGTPAPGITMNAGSVRLLGATSVGNGASASVPAIAGTGSVDAAPTALLLGSPPVAVGIGLAMVDEATTSSTAAPLGGVVTATLQGSANLIGGLMFGDLAASAVLPGISGELWLNPTGFVAAQVLGTRVSFSLVVPNTTTLRGQSFGWQGVTLGPSGLAITNPAWFCVR